MTAQIYQAKFPTFDGAQLFYRYYSSGPDTDILLVLHGQGEHSGRYEKFWAYLKDQNLSMACFDLRGHGQSEGRDVYVNEFEEYLKDLSSFASFMRERHGVRRKFILFGNSLGGLIALYWARRHEDEVKALILSAPCFGLKLSSPLIVFNQCMNQWLPTWRYPNPICVPHLTHDLREQETYRKDPLVRRRISARLLAEMIKRMRGLEDEEPIFVRFPVYIFIPGEDKIVDSDKTVVFYRALKAPRKEIKPFPGFYHEVFNEIDQDRAFHALMLCLAEVKNPRFQE